MEFFLGFLIWLGGMLVTTLGGTLGSPIGGPLGGLLGSTLSSQVRSSSTFLPFNYCLLDSL